MSQNKKWQFLALNQEIKKPTDYAHWILTQVSRTFALNISILPPKIQKTILISYLFCRMADTLEDDKQLSLNKKKDLLSSFSNLLFSKGSFPNFQLQLPNNWKNSQNYDQFLTYHGHIIFSLFKEIPPQDKICIQKWVQEMVKGMTLFLPNETHLNNHQESKHSFWIIKNIRHLDLYCYFVAGTIGKMLTELFKNNSIYISKYLKKKLDIYANSFGIGLQITNILKDVQSDQNRRISFLPLNLILEQTPIPDDFFTSPPLIIRPVIKTLVSITQTHLEEALNYSLLIPRIEFRLRLFCLWPLFMAIATLSKITQENLDLSKKTPVKISRKEVKKIMFKTLLFCWSNTLLKRYFQNYNQQINFHLYS